MQRRSGEVPTDGKGRKVLIEETDQEIRKRKGTTGW